MNFGEIPPQAQQPTAPAAPGWFPTGDGTQRYWDGVAWTDHISPLQDNTHTEQNNWALAAHLSPIVVGFLGPLILFLIKKDESPYVRHHAAEALNFQITIFVAAVAAVIVVGAGAVLVQSATVLLLLAVLVIPASIVTLVFSVLAAVAANRGEMYRYPINLRLIS